MLICALFGHRNEIIFEDGHVLVCIKCGKTKKAFK